MKLFLFKVGSFIYPDIAEPIPVPAYLIQTESGKNILVDTGFPERYINNPPAAYVPMVAVDPEDYIVNHLAEIELKPTDIDLVVLSHLDFDHTGNLLPFAHAEIIVQRLQYETAKAGHTRFASTKDQWNDASIKFRLIDGDQELEPGLKLIESSGHVPGHQSILLRLPETGAVLVCERGQRIQDPEETPVLANLRGISSSHDLSKVSVRIPVWPTIPYISVPCTAWAPSAGPTLRR